MEMLNTQRYLICNGVEAIQEDPLNIQVREYPEEGIMTLNYSQIDSPKLDPIVRECRGLILEMAEPYNIVARSFDRFFNLNECPRTDEWINGKVTNSHVLEKLDGTLITVYYWNGAWRCATRKMAFAEGETRMGNTYADVFQRVVDMNVFDLHREVKSTCFLFEMVSPETRVVKPYPEDDVYLLAVRYSDIDGPEGEWSWDRVEETALDYGFKVPERYYLKDINDILRNHKTLDAFEEGHVLCDYNDMARIKIKNPSYLAIAHLRGDGAISLKRIALLVMEQDHEEYLSYFPEDRKYFDPYIHAYEKMHQEVDILYNEYKNIEDQKEFALKVKDYPCCNILFMMRKGQSYSDIVDRMTPQARLRLMDAYVENGKK